MFVWNEHRNAKPYTNLSDKYGLLVETNDAPYPTSQLQGWSHISTSFLGLYLFALLLLALARTEDILSTIIAPETMPFVWDAKAEARVS